MSFDYESVVFRPDQLPEEKVFPVLSTGWPELDPYWKISRGQFILIAGKPNRGKTVWVSQLAIQLAQLHQWRIGIIDFEARLRRTRQRLIEMKARKAVEYLHGDALREAEAFVAAYFRIVSYQHQPIPEDPTDEEEATVASLIGLMRHLREVHTCDLVILDPWNEADHYRESYETETEYTGHAIKLLKRAAMRLDLALIVTAHPYKLEDGKELTSPYQIAGSAHWYNKPDVILLCNRAKGSSMLKVTVEKIRDQETVSERPIPGNVEFVYDQGGRHFSDIPPEALRGSNGLL